MTIGSLFSGIGGLELGLEMCGLGPVVWQCDSDPCARAVLEAHWPGVKRYEDVRSIDGKAERPEIICGGFPCQPVSSAGKRKAQADKRWLWPFFASVVAELRPRCVFIENVGDLRARGLRDVLADLATLGFSAEWAVLPASDAGAPHRRRRLFVLAYTYGQRQLQQGRTVGAQRGRASHSGGEVAGLADADRIGELEPHHEAAPVGDGRTWSRENLGGGMWWTSEPDVGRVAHGVPARLDRLRLLGNACVPAQAALAWRALSARAFGKEAA